MSTCTACNTRPVQDATVCTPCADDLARALGDVTALVTRPCRHRWPTKDDLKAGARPGRCLDCGRAPILREQHGALPSSVFDLPSGAAIVGRNRDLGRQLDITRAHQAVITRKDTARGKPGDRVYAPRRGLDRAQAALHGCLTIWANVVQAERDPREITTHRPNGTTGQALGDLAGWLLHHVDWLRHHHAGHDAVTQITQAVERVERAVDRAPDRMYVGPCWQPDPNAPTGECTADLYAELGDTTTTCPRCAYRHDVEQRRQWLREHAEDALGTATEVSRSAAVLGLAVTPERIRQWKARGQIAAHGSRQVGKRALPLYRVGDVIALAGDDTPAKTA